ncbi:MAG: helix-turn-helix domain-containing protein [Bacteroidales bacterium]|nr:helix-turn-helix domain-containing protein [Bacteroidales bacterium]
MRKNIKVPKILKINWIKDLSVSVVYNNGESRIIDFRKVLKALNITSDSPAYKLYDPYEFSKAELVDNTLSWSNVKQYITKKNGKKEKVPFEIGADVLLKYSKPEKPEFLLEVGKKVKEMRMKSGLTQQELAIRSGTTRNYISRIENERSDIELNTLRKIIETGLGKHLDLQIKE